MNVVPTAYLPSISYMAAIMRYPEISIEQYDTFPKQTFRNRTTIATGNGLLTLSVPVVRTHGNHTPTHQITVSYQEPWNIRHWRAIVSAYSAAPYFLYYRDEFEHILMQKHDKLLDLNEALLSLLLRKMKIQCTIERTTDFCPAADPLPYYDSFPPYPQVFDTRFPFQPNITILDLLFNLGPEARSYLQKLNRQYSVTAVS